MLFFSLRKQNGSRKNTKTVYSPKRTRPNKKDQPTNYLQPALSTLLVIKIQTLLSFIGSTLRPDHTKKERSIESGN